jgi:hypothetical protein
MHSPLSNLQDTTNTKRTMTCVWKDRCHRHHAYHLQALVSGGSARARHWQPELVGSASESAVPGAPVFTATILRKRLGDSIDCPLDGLEIAAARNHLVEVRSPVQSWYCRFGRAPWLMARAVGGRAGTSLNGQRHMSRREISCEDVSRSPAVARDAVHLRAFFPRFRMSSTFSSILLRTTSKASF